MPLVPIPEPLQDYAQPELRRLLDQGIGPLKQWLLDLANTHPEATFHATTSWDDNVVAWYLAKFLPKLPPTSYYLQDVIVIHLPHWEENDCYNRIYTQRSGNCLIPDAFHQLLLDLTHTFGHRRMSVKELASWLEHGTTSEVVQREEALVRNEPLVHSLQTVETQLGGTIDRSTVHILTEFGTLEWMGLMIFPRLGHDIRVEVYVKGDLVLKFETFQGEKMAAWFEEMRGRGYIGPWG